MQTFFLDSKSKGQKILLAISLVFAALLFALILFVCVIQVKNYLAYNPNQYSVYTGPVLVSLGTERPLQIKLNETFTGKNPCDGLTEKECVVQMRNLYDFIPNKKVILPGAKSNSKNILFVAGTSYIWEYLNPGVKDYTRAPAFTTFEMSCEIAQKKCSLKNISLSYSLYRNDDKDSKIGRYASFKEATNEYRIVENTSEKLIARMTYTQECGQKEIEVDKINGKVFERNFSCTYKNNVYIVDPAQFYTAEIE